MGNAISTLSASIKPSLKPQEGPQEAFLSSPADIVIYGGSAGGGKTYGLLLEPLRHITTNKEFTAVIFRKNAVNIKNPGGLWDESMKLYPSTRGIPTAHVSEWRWKKGGRMKMAHLQHEDTVLEWQGAQIPLILFDELTHFSMTQFFYMLSRNRSTCGVKPYTRATTNPDAESWVATFIEWWIDQETGFPIPERSGVIRWFIRINDVIIWADTSEELIEEYSTPEQEVIPKSVTFIPSKLEDNKELMRKDPGYKANLLAQSRVEKGRLLDGNWKIKPMAGMYFKRHEVQIVPAAPDGITHVVRKWDLAATEESEGSNPDWTVGVKMGVTRSGKYVVLDVVRVRKRASEVRTIVKNVASQDGYTVKIHLSQDPGQAGKDQIQSYVTMLAGYKVTHGRETGDKVTRAEPFAAQWQHGNVEIVEAPWNEAYLSELENFPSLNTKDDQVDGSSGAFTHLAKNNLIVWERLGKGR